MSISTNPNQKKGLKCKSSFKAYNDETHNQEMVFISITDWKEFV